MPESSPARPAEAGPSAALVTMLAFAAGALVANLYYAQPLVAVIAPAIGVSPQLAGAVVSATQAGYGAGLFLLVSLADLVENRRLVLVMLALTVVGLLGSALSASAAPFFLSVFLTGLFSTAAQVLVPFVAHLVPEQRRGRVIGNVMAGVLSGIMLARPVALFISGAFGWRTVFWLAAAVIIVLGGGVARMMPRHQPPAGMHYGQVLTSTLGMLRRSAVRWRATYQGLLFAAFNLFWTVVPLELGSRFGLSQHGIGLFALAGASGALVAPLAGRLADRGHTALMTVGGMGVLALSFLASVGFAQAACLWGLVLAAVLIDAAVQVNQITSQRIVFSGPAHIRGRVNAMYMTITFAGGAAGSLLGTLSYHAGGWRTSALTGTAIGVLLVGLFALEKVLARPRAAVPEAV